MLVFILIIVPVARIERTPRRYLHSSRTGIIIPTSSYTFVSYNEKINITPPERCYFEIVAVLH